MTSILLVGSVLAGQVDAAAEDDLRAEVRRLVRQLNATRLAQREAADGVEHRLMRYGGKPPARLSNSKAVGVKDRWRQDVGGKLLLREGKNPDRG